MAYDQREIAIMTQTSAKIAGEMASTWDEFDPVASGEWFALTTEMILNTIMNLVDQRLVTQAMPGTTQVAAPAPDNVTPIQPPQTPVQPPQPPAQAPTPQGEPQQQAPQQQGQVGPPQYNVTAASSQDDIWADIINNPNHWKDQRNDSSKGTGPDFKHISVKNDKGYTLGIWTHYEGNLKVPEWARSHLGY